MASVITAEEGNLPVARAVWSPAAYTEGPCDKACLRTGQDPQTPIAQGRSNIASASAFTISPRVVEEHAASIFAKLGLALPATTTAGCSRDQVPGVITAASLR